MDKIEEQKEKKPLLKQAMIRKAGFIIISNVCYALSFVLFYLNNKIAAGGFAGIATALSKICPISPGMLTLLMTAPFLIWGVVQKGWLFSIETIISSVMFSAFEDFFILIGLPTLAHHQWSAAMAGAVLYSLGTLFMLYAGVSAGGTDLVVILIRNHIPRIPHGTLQAVLNGLCILIGAVIFGSVESGIFSVVAIVMSGFLSTLYARVLSL